MFEAVTREVIGELEYSIIPGWDNMHDHNLEDYNERVEFLRSNCPQSIRLIPIADLDIK